MPTMIFSLSFKFKFLHPSDGAQDLEKCVASRSVCTHPSLRVISLFCVKKLSTDPDLGIKVVQ